VKRRDLAAPGEAVRAAYEVLENLDQAPATPVVRGQIIADALLRAILDGTFKGS
jgi:hypothetical protein